MVPKVDSDNVRDLEEDDVASFEQEVESEKLAQKIASTTHKLLAGKGLVALVLLFQAHHMCRRASQIKFHCFFC